MCNISDRIQKKVIELQVWGSESRKGIKLKNEPLALRYSVESA